MSQPLLDVKDVSVAFQTQRGSAQAIDQLTFSLQHGETLGIVGESGSGKSVSSLAIMDLLPPENCTVTGEIRLQGRELLTLSKRDRRQLCGDQIAMIFQEPMTSLNPLHSCGDQIMEPLLAHKKADKKQAKKRALELLELVGIPAPEQRFAEYPHQLSGGMRQRVMIAMALACEPSLLIADEPTTALDVTIQAQILDLLKKLQSEFEMGVMMITHDLGVISEICSRVLVMYAGQIVEQGSMETILNHPKHPYTAGLVAAIPRIGGEEKRLQAIDGMVPDIAELPQGCRFQDRCAQAMPHCAIKQPPNIILEDDRQVRCFLYHTEG